MAVVARQTVIRMAASFLIPYSIVPIFDGQGFGEAVSTGSLGFITFVLHSGQTEQVLSSSTPQLTQYDIAYSSISILRLVSIFT